MSTQPVMACIVDGCRRPAHRGTMCWGHQWRARNGLPLEEPLAPRNQTPLEVFREALAKYVEADPFDKAAHEKAWHRLRVAARRWVLAPKPTDPRRRQAD